MKNHKGRLRLDQPASYEIRVQGWLDEGREIWFDGMTVTVEREDDGRVMTTLTGTVADQAALYGLLAKVRDLALPLVSVNHTQFDREV